MVDNVVKLANKLIRRKIIEIALVAIFLGVSIPIWGNFEKQISAANITTIKDYPINFMVNKNNRSDNLIVDNPYNINKNYRVYLVVDKEINAKKTILTVNKENYILDEFYGVEEEKNIKYSLIDSNLAASVESYEISLKINGENKEYQYIFEEKNNF